MSNPNYHSYSKKTGVYIDVQNIYYTVKQQFGCHFNYLTFMQDYLKKENLCFAKAFATNKNDPSQIRFQTLLKSYGYEVKLIDYILRKDNSAKADWDVGIALEMVNDVPKIDRLILASGDGDFSFVIQNLKMKKPLEVIVYGVQGLTASKLIEHADRYVPIDHDLLLSIPQKW